MNDKTRAGLSSNARWSFRASFVKVIKTENSLYLTNEDRQDIYLHDYFSLFLDVQSAPTSYETPCTCCLILRNFYPSRVKRQFSALMARINKQR